MKIDHMIFNSKKWYEGEVPNYIGKKIQAPKKGKILAHVQHNQVYSSNGVVFSAFMPNDNVLRLTTSQLSDVKILGQTIGDDGTWYIFVVVSFQGTMHTEQNCIAISLDELIQNGGYRIAS